MEETAAGRLLRRCLGSAVLFAVLMVPAFGWAQRDKLENGRQEPEAQQAARTGERDRDTPEKVVRREQWFMMPRIVPGKSSSELLRQATEYKFKQRGILLEMERVRRQMAAPTGSTTVPSTTIPVGSSSTVWTPLGPKPIVHDPADTQDYGSSSGRVSAVAVDQADATGATVYVGGAYGGVWKSTNANAVNKSTITWTPILDNQATLAVGAIAVNGSTILVGTGEAKSAVDSYYGLGILRSTDGGNSWTLIQNADGGVTRMAGLGFAHIVFNTSNPSQVVATTIGTGLSVGLGALTGISFPRGVFYSTDGGATWHSVQVTENSVTFQASSNGLVYNAQRNLFYVAMRYHGVYSSPDGATWTRTAAEPGSVSISNCPSTFTGVVPNACPFWRGELTARTDKDEMYTWFANDSYTSQGVYKTTDGGATWTHLNTTPADTCDDSGTCTTYQLFYNMMMAAIPNKADTDPNATDLYIGSGNIFKCTINTAHPTCGTVGTAYQLANEPYEFMDVTHVYRSSACQTVAKVHPDQQAIGYSTALPNIVYFGHDGGITRTLNSPGINTQSCVSVSLPFDNLNDNIGSMTQFIWATPDPTDATGVLAGAQDNGSSATGATIKANHGLSGQQFWEVMSGDGGHTEIRRDTTPNIWYQSLTDAIINECSQGQNCGFSQFGPSVYIDNTASSGENLGGDSSALYAPYMLDPQSLTHLIVGTCRIWRGNSVPSYAGAAISPNFNSNTVQQCGSASTLSKIQSVAMGGPTTANGSQVIYAGMDDGTIWRTFTADNGTAGGNWVNVTPPTTLNWGASASGFAFPISALAVDTTDSTGKTVYATVQGFGANHVLVSTDGGATWTGIGAPGLNGLPDAPADTLAIDPDDHTVIYVGTDVGVFVTTNNGGSWAEVGPTEPGGASTGYLPNTVVTHIAISKASGSKQIVASTYGRGVWSASVPAPNTPPFGSLDYALNAVNNTSTVPQSGSLVAGGWAADKEDGAPVAQVNLLIDGTPVGSAQSMGLSRPDVATAFNDPRYTNSGWSFTLQNIGPLTAGTHTVSAVAVDSKNATSTIGSQTITVVANHPPFGFVDAVANDFNHASSTVAANGKLFVQGWAADQEDGAPVARVEIRIDGSVLLSNATLGDARPDVAAAFNNPAYTNSGYHATIDLTGTNPSVGGHTITVFAYDSAGISTQIGSNPITVAANHPPFGSVDAVVSATDMVSTTVGQYAKVYVTGWAADQEDGAPVNSVKIAIDNPSGVIQNAVLGDPRADVAAAFSNVAYTNSGYHAVFVAAMPAGTHTVYVTATDSLGISTVIGSKTLTVTTNTLPFGNLDIAGSAANPANETLAQFSNLFASGWVADLEDGVPGVQILIDGNVVGTATTGDPRPDVASAFGNAAYTNSGFHFNYNIGSLSVGSHFVDAVATDSAGASIVVVGRKTITVQANTAPFGSVDLAVSATNHASTSIPQYAKLFVVGWAADPEDGAPVTKVQVLIDGSVVGNATLGDVRTDVATAFGNAAYTNSGWHFTYNIGSLAVGTHAVTAVAYDSVGGNKQIGSAGITVTANHPPFGSVDVIGNAMNLASTTVPQNANLFVNGWAADVEDGAPVAQVQILIDGNPIGNASLGDVRTDVASALGNAAYTNSGWHFTTNIGALTVGTHTVTVIATDSAGAAQQIGSGPITVTANASPFGNVDIAASASNPSSTVIPQNTNLYAGGWAADPEDGAPVTKVQVLIDGSVVGNATLGDVRTDVATAFGNAAYTNSGWHFTYNIGSLAVGAHAVSAVAWDSVGGNRTLNSIAITVQ